MNGSNKFDQWLLVIICLLLCVSGTSFLVYLVSNTDPPSSAPLVTSKAVGITATNPSRDVVDFHNSNDRKSGLVVVNGHEYEFVINAYVSDSKVFSGLWLDPLSTRGTPDHIVIRGWMTNYGDWDRVEFCGYAITNEGGRMCGCNQVIKNPNGTWRLEPCQIDSAWFANGTIKDPSKPESLNPVLCTLGAVRKGIESLNRHPHINN